MCLLLLVDFKIFSSHLFSDLNKMTFAVIFFVLILILGFITCFRFVCLYFSSNWEHFPSLFLHIFYLPTLSLRIPIRGNFHPLILPYRWVCSCPSAVFLSVLQGSFWSSSSLPFLLHVSSSVKTIQYVFFRFILLTLTHSKMTFSFLGVQSCAC